MTEPEPMDTLQPCDVRRIMGDNEEQPTSGNRISTISSELSKQARSVTELRASSCNEDYDRRPTIQGDS